MDPKPGWPPGDGPDRTESKSPSYPFVAHSQIFSTHDQDALPQTDSSGVSRQKRRRTSPQDHAILEAAYLQNSKPDKAERAILIDRVALGEKAVQVWFQNRRQNDRRKSRPLLPHEMVPHFQNSVPENIVSHASSSFTTTPWTPNTSFSSATSDVNNSQSNNRSEEGNEPTSRASSIHDLLNPVSPEKPASAELKGVAAGQECSGKTLEPTACVQMAITQKNHVYTSVEASQRGVLALFEQSKVSAGQEELGGAPIVNAGSKPAITNRKRVLVHVDRSHMLLSRSSSARLSMTLDGAVKVKTTEEVTPSPPKPQAVVGALLARNSLKRSSSATVLGESSGNSRKSRGVFGRSRDARTWEFYCDGDARDALSAQAENENRGSAVGVIKLIRSQSDIAKNKVLQAAKAAPLQPIPNAQNNTKRRSGLMEQKSKAVRAVSSLTRLSGGKVPGSQNPNPRRHVRTNSSDSDKENWAPGTRESVHPLRRTQSSVGPSRGILQDQPYAVSPKPVNNHKRTLLDKNAVMLARGINNSDILFDDNDGDKGEELDCVQGLLSLSQGAWK